MADELRALVAEKRDDDVDVSLRTLTRDDLPDGDVTVRVAYSSVNYKDALAVSPKGRVARADVLVPGIDLAGEVVASDSGEFSEGDEVIVHGYDLGVAHHGGYAEFARVPAEWVVPLPEGLSLRQAMALGTAGFTAALAIHRMEHNGQAPARGPVVVTGATGGVGSIAIDMLAGRGYEVIAVTGKAESADYLKSLGASQVILREALPTGSRPLETTRYAGVIDNVGGEMLANLLRQVDFWGNVASIGLAGGANLETTVLPFILRGVNLLGINSSATRRAERLAVWERIAGDCAPRHLDHIVTRTIAFADLPGAFQPHIDGKVTGRTVVKIGSRP